VGLGLLWVAVLAAAEWYRGTGPLPAVIEAASYGVFLPLLAWMATVEGHRLVSSVPAAFAVEAATPPLAPLLGLAVALAACGGSAGAPESGPVPPRLAVAGLAHRQCRYVEAGTASAFSRQTRPGTRGDIALWGRAMETEDTVELSIRYDDGGRLEWVRALRATLPAGRVADLERLIFSNLLESGPADWGIRVRVIGGDVAGAEPSVICRPEREVGGTLPMTPVTARALQELYDVRGRRFGVIVTLDEQGRVMNAEIDRPTGYTSVDQYIMDLVRASRFEPKLHDGFGVATTYEFPIWFRRR
jgi:TonB family protein